jgi:hypothetical protein
MDDKRTPKRILEWKPIGMRIRGRPRKRWIVDIEEDMQIMGLRRRKECKERAEWKRITEKAKNPQWVVMPVKEEEFVISNRRFGTTYRSHPWCVNPEDGTDRLSQNVGKRLPLLAP